MLDKVEDVNKGKIISELDGGFPLKQLTPLYIACETNQLEIVKLLLDKGADVNFRPRLKTKTPLFLACENENLEMVNLLLEKDADVKLLNDDLRSDEKDISPLFKACETGNIYIAKRLLDEDADLKIKVSYYPRRTAFFIACTHNKTEIVKLLIKERSTKLNTDDFCVQKAFHEACRENCVNVIKFLLSKTETFNIIDLNKIDDYYKFSKFEIPDNTHDTPLYAACKKGHNKIVELLLAKRADVNKVNTNTKEDTPLYAACEEGHNEIVELLLDKEANVNHVNNDNKYTPLSIACKNGNVKNVELLLANGADVNHADNDNNTPLHIACQECRVVIVYMLVKKGANVSQKNKDGKDPSDIREEKQNEMDLDYGGPDDDEYRKRTYLGDERYAPKIIQEILELSIYYEGQNESCSICLEQLGTIDVVKTNCDHYFHKSCLEKWMKQKNICPLCNNYLIETDFEYNFEHSKILQNYFERKKYKHILTPPTPPPS